MPQVLTKRIAGTVVEYEDHEKRLVSARGTQAIVYDEDFLVVPSAADTVDGWVITLVEGGAGETTLTYPDVSGGALLITTDAAENDGANLQLDGEAYGFSSSQEATYFGVRLQTGEATESDILVGLCITDTDLLGGMTDGVYFRKVDGSTSMAFVTEKDSSETSTAGVLTVAASTNYILEFYFDGSSVQAFVDGALKATHTATIPNDELLTPSIHFLTGNAAAETLQIDWIRAIQIGR